MEADGVLPLPVSSHTPTISAAEELALEELREKRRVLEAKWAEEGEYYTVRRGQNFCVAAHCARLADKTFPHRQPHRACCFPSMRRA